MIKNKFINLFCLGEDLFLNLDNYTHKFKKINIQDVTCEYGLINKATLRLNFDSVESSNKRIDMYDILNDIETKKLLKILYEQIR